MFCPNAADWGNVADWVSGLGSIVVGSGALYVAAMERNRAQLAEKRALEAEVRANRFEDERFNSLIMSAERIIDITRDAGRTFVNSVKDNIDKNSAKNQWITFVRMQNKRALRMLDFPTSEPLLYACFDALATFTDLHEYSDMMDPEPLAEKAVELDAILASLKDGARTLAKQYRERRG